MQPLSLVSAMRINSQNHAIGNPVKTVSIIANYGASQFCLFLQAYLTQYGQPIKIIDAEYDSLINRLSQTNSQNDKNSDYYLIILDSDTLGSGSSLRKFSQQSNGSIGDSTDRSDLILSLVTSFAASHTKPVFIMPLPVMSNDFESLPSVFARARDGKWAAAISQLLDIAQTRENLVVITPPQLDLDQYKFLKTGEPIQSKIASTVALTVAHTFFYHQKGEIPGVALKKLLITDLDNTFWSGILGDDGWENLACDESERGHIHFLYQKFLYMLSLEGVILAVASKNTKSIVDEAFTKMSLVLPPDRFALVEASWTTKSEAIQGICHKLNLTMDSVVFIDDNPIEIAEVSLAHPSVSTILFPSNLEGVTDLFKSLRSYFVRGRMASDVEKRLQSYKGVVQLNSLKQVAESTDRYRDYLKSLDMQLYIHRVEIQELDRVFELINKTNQFNLTGDRYSRVDFDEICTGGFCGSVILKDNLSNFGTIGAFLIKIDRNSAVIEQCVLSCRVFSRGIETEMLRAIEALLTAQGIAPSNITMRLKRTAKNQPVFEFLTKIGAALPITDNATVLYIKPFTDVLHNAPAFSGKILYPIEPNSPEGSTHVHS